MRDISLTALAIPSMCPLKSLKWLEYSAKIFNGKVFVLEERMILIKRKLPDGTVEKY